MHNLMNRVMLFLLAPDGAGSGSAENGAPAPGNAEDQLASAFTGGAGAAGAQPAAEPKDGDKAAGETQPDGGIKLAAWTEQLPPEIRGNPDTAAKLAKFAKVGDMAKAFLELEGRAASGGVPGKDAAAEEVAAFWEKAGRPKTADGYAFAKDAEHAGAEFAAAAFGANLTAAQADAMFGALNGLAAQRLQASAQARQRQMKETAAALAAEYGSNYQEKMELLKRGITAAGPNVAAILEQAGLAGNPEIVKAFIAFGEMTAESGAPRGRGSGEPLKSVMEGGTFEFKS
jgi:hypothetical protein